MDGGVVEEEVAGALHLCSELLEELEEVPPFDASWLKHVMEPSSIITYCSNNSHCWLGLLDLIEVHVLIEGSPGSLHHLSLVKDALIYTDKSDIL